MTVYKEAIKIEDQKVRIQFLNEHLGKIPKSKPVTKAQHKKTAKKTVKNKQKLSCKVLLTGAA
jgi:hypothetical protein